MKKLAIVTTHPIQYYAPIFKLLTANSVISIKVFYTWGEKAKEKFDPGFSKEIAWDIPLLEGYAYEWVKNTSTDPGSHHFWGIINPVLIDQIESWKPNAVLIFGWAYRGHLKVLLHFKNKLPVYFRGDSSLLDKQKRGKSLLRSLFLKWVYSHVDHVFYVGSNNKAYFEKYGLKNNQLIFTPHAIENKRFGADRTTEANKLRQNLNINKEDIILLFAGKFEKKKSPQLLMNAFLALNMPQTHLLFTGSGILEMALKTNASKSKNIHFLDFQNQSLMPVVYQACDVFCLPSKGPGETWGLAVNEAMAAGKPVLVSNKCGCAVDLVTDDNGVIFKSEDQDDLIIGLKKLLIDKKSLIEHGTRSKEIIQYWNFSEITRIIEKKLLNEEKRSS